MSRRRKSPGFSLIELIVAMFLSSIVLMGIFSIMTNMVSSEINSMRDGTVTGWSLAGINAMTSDIAGAGAITYPAAGSSAASLSVCTNWLTQTGAAVIKNSGNKVYWYCWDTVDAAPSPYANALLRSVKSNVAGSEACPVPPAACSQATYDAGDFGSDIIVATGVYPDPAAAYPNIFTTDGKMRNAVRLDFVVGNPAVGAKSAGGSAAIIELPVSETFNTEIFLED